MFLESLLEFISLNKKKIIIFIIILIIFIILMIFNKHMDNKINGGVNEYVTVYDSDTINDQETKLPYIMIDSDNIFEINKEIMSIYYENVELEEKYMDYEAYLNDNVLSLIVKLYYFVSNEYVPSDVYIYNIDINKKMALSNYELLSLYNIDEDTIEEKIIDEINDYYEYEVSNNYITNCDFDCYIEPLEGDIFKNIYYYVKDGSIYAYRYFSVDSSFAYDTNKPFDLYNFKIN